jgi:biopolymer transport protein ExbD
MGRAKLPRKSTTVDMTAMCDVAFLLLSFFILTTKFKPSEAVTVTTPNSVSTQVAPEEDIILITMNKDGKVFFGVDKKDKRELIINSLNSSRNLGLSAADVKKFADLDFVGAPISKLKEFIYLRDDQRTDANLPGIPVQDTANNELTEWVSQAVFAYKGEEATFMIKGDNVTKFPIFKNVIAALKKNNQLKFKMVTNPENAPPGTELYKAGLSGKKQSEL